MTSKLSFFSGSKKKQAQKYAAFNESSAVSPPARKTSSQDVLGDLCTCGRGRGRKANDDNKMPKYHVVAAGEKGAIGKNELLLKYIFGNSIPTDQDCDEFDPQVDQSYTLQREINKESAFLTIESWEAEDGRGSGGSVGGDDGGGDGADIPTDSIALSFSGEGATGEPGGATAAALFAQSSACRTINWESIDKRFIEEENFPDGFLLIYSVTSLESFNKIPEIHGQILSIAQKHRQLHSLLVPSEESSSYSFCPPPMLLVANNVGPIFIRKVSSAQGKAMASQLDVGYIEACPKSPPMNIVEVFSRLCDMIKKARQQMQDGAQKKKKKPFNFSRSLPSSPPSTTAPSSLLSPLGGAAFASNV